jgi:hypothetical protein
MLRVSPGTVQVGAAFTMAGSHYHCTGPTGKILLSPRIVLYRPGNGIVPGVGFTIFTVHVRPNGTFSHTTTMPARLHFITSITGGPNRNRRVPIASGVYYPAIRLFDTSLPPPSQADARVTVSLDAPSAADMAALMARTVEVGHRSTHFIPIAAPLTVVDGRGTGTLTAAVGVRHPPTGGNGTGELVFFWHNRTYVGWDAPYETPKVLDVESSAPGSFIVTYARYRKGDKVCCPSGAPFKEYFGWSGHILIGGAPPAASGAIRVRLLPRG